MGWDVVQIGIGHDLPVDDFFETARVLAERMKRNIKLVYSNEYEYDVANNIATVVDEIDWIELGRFDVNGSNDYLRMEVYYYQANKIKETVGVDNIRVAAQKNEYGEWLLNDIENSPYALYELEDEELDINITIHRENVDIGVNVWERWSHWEGKFHLFSFDNIAYLHNYRMQIYNTARMFGCSEVIICADQGPTEFIYDRKNRSADYFKEYVRSFQYLKDYGRAVENFDVENWKKNAKHISFSSYFKNEVLFSEEDFVEVIFDDFSDIERSR